MLTEIATVGTVAIAIVGMALQHLAERNRLAYEERRRAMEVRTRVYVEYLRRTGALHMRYLRESWRAAPHPSQDDCEAAIDTEVSAIRELWSDLELVVATETREAALEHVEALLNLAEATTWWIYDHDSDGAAELDYYAEHFPAVDLALRAAMRRELGFGGAHPDVPGRLWDLAASPDAQQGATPD